MGTNHRMLWRTNATAPGAIVQVVGTCVQAWELLKLYRAITILNSSKK